MLIEQLALAHLNSGRLFQRSAIAAAAPDSVALAGAAARIMAEVRRTAIVLDRLRAKAPSRRQKVAKPQSGRRLKGNRTQRLPAARNRRKTTVQIRQTTETELPPCIPSNPTLPTIALPLPNHPAAGGHACRLPGCRETCTFHTYRVTEMAVQKPGYRMEPQRVLEFGPAKPDVADGRPAKSITAYSTYELRYADVGVTNE